MSDDLYTRLRSKFRLDKDRGWIFGLCAGLANCWHTDPAFVRVGVTVAALFFPKLVIASYLVAWLLLDDRSVLNNR
jgi:phage shock protein PspC (stress-responsive transcriptional regulator)